MNKIKFLKNNCIALNGIKYRGYAVGELPPSFGYIYNEDTETDGIKSFFNFKGLTFLKDK